MIRLVADGIVDVHLYRLRLALGGLCDVAGTAPVSAPCAPPPKPLSLPPMPPGQLLGLCGSLPAS